ncbi:MAG: sulfotransferase [Gammaproteobacteria bacterium]|nr:sulfotransferase [Gammaproteobacteria bacterium]
MGFLLTKAFKLHQNGKLDAARDLYRRILKQDPDHFDALQLLGAVELGNNQYNPAVTLISRAISQRTDLPDLHTNLGIGLAGLNRFPDALSALRRALELDPDFFQAHFHLGRLYLLINLPEQALPCLRNAIRLQRSHSESALMLAEATILTRGIDEGLASLDGNLGAEDLPAAYRNLGQRLRSRREWSLALTVLERAWERGYTDQEIALGLGEMLESTNQLDRAWSIVEPLIGSAQQSHPLLIVLAGRLRRRLGQLDEAADMIERGLRKKRSADQAAALHKELGKIRDKQGDYKAAWSAFESANRLMGVEAKRLSLNKGWARQLITACGRWSDARKPVSLAAATQDEPQVLPQITFFCGFPRSGTTLVEELLARHPRVVTTQETPALSKTALMMPELLGTRHSFPAGIDQLDESQLERLREVYLANLGISEIPENGHIVDKMPLNTWFLPLALRLFPNARVLFALRNPLDVCLSCFIQYFKLNDSMVHFLDIDDTAKLYRDTFELWERYKSSVQPDYLEYRYEELVTDPSATLTEILSFLGLDPVDVLSGEAPSQPNRAVFTPSYEAVNTSINTKAVNRWRNYSEHLGGIRERLEPLMVRYGYTYDSI